MVKIEIPAAYRPPLAYVRHNSWIDLYVFDCMFSQIEKRKNKNKNKNKSKNKQTTTKPQQTTTTTKHQHDKTEIIWSFTQIMEVLNQIMKCFILLHDHIKMNCKLEIWSVKHKYQFNH